MTTKRQVPDPSGTDFASLSELTLLACLVAGEARGEPPTGKIAVAWVARNRVEANQPKWFGEGWHGVILKPWQFSCFNSNDPNSALLRFPTDRFGAKVWRECYAAASAVYFGLIPDPTSGADHYRTAAVSPDWSKGRVPVATVANHLFFRLRGVAV